MSSSVCSSESNVDAIVEREIVPSGSKDEGAIGESVAPQRSYGHVTNSDVVSSAENACAERATEDLEALQPVPSGPAYSVFSDRQRKLLVFMVACAGFFSPLSANIYFPALNALSQDLKVSNELINLTLTSYMIFQGLAPTIFGDLADMAGRRPAYVLGFIIYIGRDLYPPTSENLTNFSARRKHRACFAEQLRCFVSTTMLAEHW